MKLLQNLIILNVINLSLVWGIDFTPAPVSSHSFGSLNIGWLHSTITGVQSNEVLQDYKSTRNAMLFGLKRGLILTEQKNLLLNAWIDGSAGRENKNGLYNFSLGGQIGYRFFGGRVIAFVGGGFEMGNLAMADPKEQYNIYGGIARAEMFVDIAQGYGLSVGYTRGFNEKSKKLLGEHFDTQSFYVSISYYDFSL
ncbi:hypothetical protein OQH61_02915 [Helicobacter sp. MIT 21-1697]|uniref:hypothetical protein n=1 Tax=Helicobacter sp. MIT 21-1697 TaxID=2993733 RepID=UPI00224B5C29|nr:hypothetical protein [Helicobacter sp. MIT 21-1697]MCX2716682.1 hypothetical protein [Helicobacter sp. MIT 21-1697]